MNSQNDAALLDALAEMWAELDPMPEDLVAQMSAVVEAACAAETLAEDYELLTLVAADAAALEVRSDPETLVVIEFTGRDVQVLLRLSQGRLDGWAAPAAAGSATLVPVDGPSSDPVDIDDDGRFAIRRAPNGPATLRITFADGRRYETPPFVV
ncbi:hypothetical protein [Salana multivorans]